MCEVYKCFTRDFPDFDYSDRMMLELYYSESYGDQISEKNGFYLGKKLLNITVSMWKDDIQKGLLFKHELLSDDSFPKWWIKKVVKKL